MNWQRRGVFAAAALITLGATACTTPVSGPTSPPAAPTATSAGPTATGDPKTGGSASGDPASPAPAPTKLAAAMMLQGADVPGTTVDDQPRAGYDGTLEPLVGRCDRHPALLTTAYVAGRDRAFRYSDGRSVYQSVAEYAEGDAARRLAWYRAAVAACPSFDPGGGTRTLRITAQNVAGDDSIVVEDATAAGRQLYVLVRVGNRFTEVILRPADDAFGRVLGQRAAGHL